MSKWVKIIFLFTEIIIVKEGVLHGHTAGGHGDYFDSREATLDFSHTIKLIKGTLAYDLNGTILNKLN